jgi:HicA toxin of bacterial toxin-antitoxin,
MANSQRLTAIIQREDDSFVSLCPELDIASQGSSIEEARANQLGKFRVLPGLEVCRILEQNGFTAVRQRGSHRVMQKRLDDIVRQSGLQRGLFEAG